MDFEFVAAQRLPNVGALHRAARLHGHTFRVRVRLTGTPDPHTGWIIDPAVMKAKVSGVLAAIDHRYLNDVPGLENPSTEILCRYLSRHIGVVLPGRVAVELWENPAVGCAMTPGQEEEKVSA